MGSIPPAGTNIPRDLRRNRGVSKCSDCGCHSFCYRWDSRAAPRDVVWCACESGLWFRSSEQVIDYAASPCLFVDLPGTYQSLFGSNWCTDVPPRRQEKYISAAVPSWTKLNAKPAMAPGLALTAAAVVHSVRIYSQYFSGATAYQRHPRRRLCPVQSSSANHSASAVSKHLL